MTVGGAEGVEGGWEMSGDFFGISRSSHGATRGCSPVGIEVSRTESRNSQRHVTVLLQALADLLEGFGRRRGLDIVAVEDGRGVGDG